MWPVFRITKSSDVSDIVHSEEQLKAFARDHGPGRFHVDEHSLDPFEGSNAKARQWGKVIHHDDGRVILKPFFFGDHDRIPDII
jgi:hypothetical protein